jgi:YVTN family beta-propeller protein
MSGGIRPGFPAVVFAVACVAGCGASAAHSPSQHGATPSPVAALPAPKACPSPAALPPPQLTTPPEPQAASAAIQAVIRFAGTDIAPETVAVGFGSVWVAGHHSQTVYRIDPGTDRVIASIKVEVPGQETGLGAVVVGPHGVWVPVAGQPNQLWRIDPSTNQVTFKVPMDGAAGLSDGPDGLWADIDPQNGSATRRQLLQLDPDTGKTLRTVDLGPGLNDVNQYTTDLEYGLGSLWVVVGNQELARVDPSTGKVIATIHTPDHPFGYATLAFAGNDVFIAQSDRTVARVDAATNCVDGVVYLGADINPPMFGAPELSVFGAPQGLYVSFDRGVLALIDPVQLTVRKSVRFDEQNAVGTSAFGFGSVWFTTFKNDTVLRVKPLD